MNKLLLLLTLAILTTNLHAQNFGGEGTRWTYSFNADESTDFGTTTVEYDKDTLVDDKIVQKFSRTGMRLNLGKPDTQYVNLGALYLLVENEVVKISLDLQSFDTLYYFTDRLGAKWSIPLEKYGFSESINFRLIDAFREEINGVELLGQKVYWRYRSRAGIDTIRQTIGGKNLYILPWDRLYQSGEASELMCFQHNNLGLVDFGPPEWGIPYLDGYCDNLVSTTNHSEGSSRIEVFPNPVENVLHLKLPEADFINTQYDLELLNSYGQSVCRSVLRNKEQRIDTSSFPKGIYFLLLDGKYHSKVIVL